MNLVIPILLSLLLSFTHSQSISPENHFLLLPSSRKFGGDDSVYCNSWRLAVEANNAVNWSVIPDRCLDFVKDYMTGELHSSDSDVVAQYSMDFAKSVPVADDGKDGWVFDVDETLLSNLPWYEARGLGVFDEASFNEWVLKAEAPALRASLRVYKLVQQLGFKTFILTGRSEPYRNATAENLRRAGYDNWDRLILRGPSDDGKLAVQYKSEKRKELEDEGYRIRGSSGDQWSDLLGYAVADRSFKVPNPMYYIA